MSREGAVDLIGKRGQLKIISPPKNNVLISLTTFVWKKTQNSNGLVLALLEGYNEPKTLSLIAPRDIVWFGGCKYVSTYQQ